LNLKFEDDKMIDLHSCPTPNGWKISILLEELGVDYQVKTYDLMAGEHLTAEFHAINPNHKIPAIVDRSPADGGAPLSLFESGAILIYLADKYGKFISADLRKRALALQWTIWQVAGLGPMFGQASHFIRYAPGGQEYAVNRYTNEAHRLTNVLEGRLEKAEYLAEDYSIADMAVWSWVGAFPQFLPQMGIDLGEYPAVDRWIQVVGDRPAVKSAFARKDTAIKPELVKAQMDLTAEQRSNLLGENMLAASSQR
jgi:GST-like protein